MRLFPTVTYTNISDFEKENHSTGWGLYYPLNQLIKLNRTRMSNHLRIASTLLHEQIHHMISSLPRSPKGVILEQTLDNILDKVDSCKHTIKMESTFKAFRGKRND